MPRAARKLYENRRTQCAIAVNPDRSFQIETIIGIIFHLIESMTLPVHNRDHQQ